MEEERARKDVGARTAEEKGGGQASSSHDTTMTENAGIMSDKANIGDLMTSGTEEQEFMLLLDG
ncbi:hypothetical protein C5167_041844 [Papaver somniferum]|nr:hypothetical protein C5167_041844 [Papaver somniferum]